MSNGKQLRYGIIKGECSSTKIPMNVGASEVIPAGGAFVKTDGSGRLEVAGDGSTLLAGFLETEAQTASAVEGFTVGNFYPAGGALCLVVRLPITGGTFVAAMRGKTADLEVVAGVQSVQLDASAEDTVIVVDGDLVDNAWVDVMINVDKIASLTGVV